MINNWKCIAAFVCCFILSIIILLTFMEEEEVKNGLKINTWGKMITLPASFWVDNRFEHKGYTVFRQSIPDKGEFIGTILIGFGKTQVFEDILQNYISDTNLFHEGVTNYYKSYKVIEFKLKSIKESDKKNNKRMVAIHKDNHFMIFILLSKEDSWKKYLE
ncbi:MAG: hypothetical protein HOM14_08375 [Gammaproteobacteria bacterium]|jgi:hypothetical protein|nr:hypothetical protein [Gammaproteobacteria bacterium]MBT4078290.1 hypothetical protein [Gammaproteobacteria bacterium]MBT4195033.1 hypothetical protein [Gammaproteobacteria bacterium]MBT4452238.1 hypothetical protein [Gammaproteobacteria bacterium]MBT4862331.1 hypothetical protein [Gammaproteobacteria bacterium]